MSESWLGPTVRKDGRDWRVGTATDVAWITDSTPGGMEITSAIPPIYDDYATIVIPEHPGAVARQVDLVLGHLRACSPRQSWWLGYLDTGADGDPFPGAPRTRLYAGWSYALVLAGPDEAAAWRRGRAVGAGTSVSNWVKGSSPPPEHAVDPSEVLGWRDPGPDLVFPTDRSWLLSWLWDDEWRCLGGSRELVDALLEEPELEVRRVRLGEDATPPGHTAF